jgi:predicted transcriptional regulator
MDEASAPPELLRLTTAIVVAYAGGHTLPASALPGLISSVFGALRDAGTVNEPAPPAEPLRPAVPIKRSVLPDHIVCLEDGKRVTMLKRHLATHHSLTPAEYRQRWGLPADYPMAAPSYTAMRSKLAKDTGLGRKPAAAEPAPEAAPTPEPEPVPAAEPEAAKPVRRVFMRKRGKATA